MPLTQMCASVSSTCAFGTHGCSTANDANSDNLVAALYILRKAAGLEPWPEHSPMKFEFCSGLVDLVVRVRHYLGGGHRFALAGERFVGRLAEHIAEVGDRVGDFGGPRSRRRIGGHPRRISQHTRSHITHRRNPTETPAPRGVA